MGTDPPTAPEVSSSYDRLPKTDTPVPPELEAYVQRVVSAALRDPVGRREYALFQDGAAVIPQLTHPPLRTSGLGSAPSVAEATAPEAALSDDLRVGACWLIHGSSGQLGIGLHAFISPTHATIEHIPLEITADIGQAPRKMLLWGLVEGERNVALYHDIMARGERLHAAAPGRATPPRHGNQLFVTLASFDYNIFAPFHIQTFPISSAAVEEGLYFGVVVLEILDNWGGKDTCLYRVRVHGNKVVL
ncbi:hypothetical protein L226DRAFT_470550 [Lentinus tigrinus ALCF2SS1-7]|uniref:uncharacterized protein n=1 Tax=Lentinus tigrinus ALCF2SS1-7 TaxID=1328758 RepID=UPI00116629BE|nr:hypothetical protein L226DRAFT_470550 [Lentinus tigrinus ALCF2SS1-7]